MLLMLEEDIGGGICQTIYKYAKVNDKYENNYDKSIKSSYFMYLDANNLYGWAMSQKLPVNSFKCVKNLSKFNEEFIKGYNENCDRGHFLEEDVEYPKKLINLHKYLSFLPERKKLINLHNNLSFLLVRKKLEKVEKLVSGIEDKEKYVAPIRVLKQTLNHGLILKRIDKVIQFNQREWLKPYIDMNTKLRKEAKNEFEKDFFKLLNNAVFGKTMENVRNHRDIKIVTTNEKRSKLVSEPNYHTTKHLSEFFLAIEMKKKKRNKSKNE